MAVYILLLILGAAFGVALAAGLGLDRKPRPDLDAQRDAFKQGVITGHLVTAAGDWSPRQVAELADEWRDNQIAKLIEEANDAPLPANFF